MGQISELYLPTDNSTAHEDLPTDSATICENMFINRQIIEKGWITTDRLLERFTDGQFINDCPFLPTIIYQWPSIFTDRGPMILWCCVIVLIHERTLHSSNIIFFNFLHCSILQCGKQLWFVVATKQSALITIVLRRNTMVHSLQIRSQENKPCIDAIVVGVHY